MCVVFLSLIVPHAPPPHVRRAPPVCVVRATLALYLFLLHPELSPVSDFWKALPTILSTL